MSSAIPTYRFNPSQLPEFELTGLQRVVRKSRQKLYVPHRQDFYGLFYFSRSGGSHYVDFTEYKINEGDVHLISDEQVHFFENIDNALGKIILFTAGFFDNDALLEHLFEKAEQNPVISLHDEQRKYWENLLSQMENVYVSDRKFKNEILKNYLSVALFEIYQYQQEKPALHNTEYLRFVTFKKDLKTYFKTHKKVSFYAGKQNITPKTLNLAVRKIVNKSAKRFINDYVLLSAKRLLVNTNLTSAEIAYELGFDEPTNFTKFFKKTEGKSPVMFRKEYK